MADGLSPTLHNVPKFTLLRTLLQSYTLLIRISVGISWHFSVPPACFWPLQLLLWKIQSNVSPKVLRFQSELGQEYTKTGWRGQGLQHNSWNVWEFVGNVAFFKKNWHRCHRSPETIPFSIHKNVFFCEASLNPWHIKYAVILVPRDATFFVPFFSLSNITTFPPALSERAQFHNCGIDACHIRYWCCRWGTVSFHIEPWHGICFRQ